MGNPPLQASTTSAPTGTSLTLINWRNVGKKMLRKTCMSNVERPDVSLQFRLAPMPIGCMLNLGIGLTRLRWMPGVLRTSKGTGCVDGAETWKV